MDSAGLRHRSRDTSQKQPGATATAASLEIVEVKSPDSSASTTASQRPPQQNHDVDDDQASFFSPITLRPPPHSRDEDAVQPPRFTVDLSEKPGQRYRHVADHMRDAVAVSDLADLFDALVRSVTPGPLVPTLHALARHSLRRVYCAEETAELRGIAAASGIALHLLVAFNVLLDLLLGCSSGGMRVVCPGSKDGSSSSRILHFRTLDWGMEELRALTVELNFVRRPGGPVVATSVTYFGYVGVLTGVRRGLSMSLNFRPHHDRSTWRRRFGFRWHQAMVMLGFRQSVSSVLRALLLTPDPELDGHGGADTGAKQQKKWRWMRKKSSGKPDTTHNNKPDVSAPIIPYIKNQLPATRSTAAYLIFCTADEGRTLEKDNGHGRFHSSRRFHATYNHDRADEAEPQRLEHAAHSAAEEAAGMETIVGMSMSRARGMERRFGRASSRLKAKAKSKSGSEHAPGRGSSGGSADSVHDDCSCEVNPDDVLKLVLNPEICNEETHYAVVMDPGLGKVLWRRAFPLELPPESDETDEGTDGEAPLDRRT